MKESRTSHGYQTDIVEIITVQITDESFQEIFEGRI